MKNLKIKKQTLKLCFVAIFIALNVLMCTFSIPVPGGHLYLCDTVICLAALVFDPVSAFIVGGLGAFLGDLLFYPVAMVVSLFAHGFQALLISVIYRYTFKNHKTISLTLGMIVGSVIMVLGYFLGKTFVYASLEIAIVKLPYEILQAAVGAILGTILFKKCKIEKISKKYMA